MMDYTIKRIDYLSDDLKLFLQQELPSLSKKFDDKYDANYSALIKMIEKGVFFVCKRDGAITGIHISWLSSSPFDVRVKLLQQQLFYVKPESGRTAYHLFKKFIDFGKSNADYINTMIGEHTNVKPSTLKNWGFKELEVMYQMRT